jgi:hypothetical protein
MIATHSRLIHLRGTRSPDVSGALRQLSHDPNQSPMRFARPDGRVK